MVSLCNKASVYDLMSFLSYAISKFAANLCVHNPVYSLFERVFFREITPRNPREVGPEGQEGPKINGYTVANWEMGCITPRSVVTTLVYSPNSLLLGFLMQL